MEGGGAKGSQVAEPVELVEIDAALHRIAGLDRQRLQLVVDIAWRDLPAVGADDLEGEPLPPFSVSASMMSRPVWLTMGTVAMIGSAAMKSRRLMLSVTLTWACAAHGQA